MAGELKLFTTWSSPFALRAVLALKIKGLEFESVEEDLQNKSDELLKYNPVYKKVPVLVHDGLPISDSLVIVEYIDETWNHQYPLLPRDPYQKAMARFWAKFGDDKVMPLSWNIVMTEGKAQEESIDQLITNLKVIEEQLKGNKFFGGETIGYLDIAFSWIVNVVGVVEEMLERKLVDAETLPLLSTWMENCANEAVIKDCWAPRDRLLGMLRGLRDMYVGKAE